MIDFVICLALIFIGVHFAKLAKAFLKNTILYVLLGVLTFLGCFYLCQLILSILLGLLKLPYSNPLILGCFSIPFSVFITGIVYKLIEKKLIVKDTISEIGKE